MRIVTCVFILWALCGVVFTSVARGDDTDPAGMQLRQLAEEYLQSAPAGDANARKVRQATSDGFDDWDLMTILCSVEIDTGIGWIIWKNRAKADACDLKDDYSVMEYCRRYSVECDHYSWDSGCMKRHDCFSL